MLLDFGDQLLKLRDLSGVQKPLVVPARGIAHTMTSNASQQPICIKLPYNRRLPDIFMRPYDQLIYTQPLPRWFLVPDTSKLHGHEQ